MKIEYLLAQTEWFRALSKENRERLAQVCIRKSFRKKEILFLEEGRGEAVFLLAQGSVQLYKTSPSGETMMIRIVKPGEIFAEVILFEKDTYPVTAVALKTSHVYLIPKKELTRLLGDENFRNDFIRGLLEKHRYLTNRLMQIRSLDGEHRLFLFLKEELGGAETMELALSKKDVAASISVTPETLSRMILRLRKKGALRWSGRKIELKKGFWSSYK